MNDDLRLILRTLLMPQPGHEPIGGTDFNGITGSPEAAALRAAASALISDTPAPAAGPFLDDAVMRAREELTDRLASDPAFADSVSRAAETLRRRDAPTWDQETRDAFWAVFFPEGRGLFENQEAAIRTLRHRRAVQIEALNPRPIADPAREILFTANILITVPADETDLDRLTVENGLRERIRATMGEPQLYYYDHPIHIGVATDHNEAIYGMRGLNDAVAWEKRTGRIAADERAVVVLSVSVTHEGLHTVARDYLEREFAAGGPFEHLDIYLFTELECRTIVRNVLAPYLPDAAVAAVERVFGVDGEYGRHYSFLKAIAAFWQVFVDPAVRGTFKIDLDQVFPQEELAAETGESALDHFRTPLWGARGRDSEGTPVELGMIAGALVNEKDINRGVFTPDVPVPTEIPAGEAAVFYNKLPMALSTEAEMMLRYTGTSPDGDAPDGTTRCALRYHVTGGTNGILVDSLRRHRPFTPSFVGRAEDQAFLLSVLYEPDDGGRVLRYVHKPGLIMRHDKEAFAGESIRAAAHGRFVGDLARTWIFSRYAAALSWGFTRTKGQIDPFTGCFATPMPVTISVLRLLLHCGALLSDGGTDSGGAQAVRQLLEVAQRKLPPLWDDPHGVATGYRRERTAWRQFYDALEAAAAAGGPDSAARRSATDVVDSARIG